MTKPSALTTKPDPLPCPAPKTIFTTLAWTRSTMSARDDLPSSDKSAAPMIWTLTVVLGVGVEVGTGVFGLVNRGNFVMSGSMVPVSGESSVPAGTPLSPPHAVSTSMASKMSNTVINVTNGRKIRRFLVSGTLTFSKACSLSDYNSGRVARWLVARGRE